MLLDGFPYAEILKELGPIAAHITEHNITTWAAGGYKEWQDEQFRLEETRVKQEVAMDLACPEGGSKIHEATLQLAATRLSAYYLDSTWETQLPTFKTTAEPNVYQRLPDGTAILDGYPIVWTDVMQSFTTSVTADTAIAVFGAMSFWWMGEHGSPRIDTSEHVYFANDQLAIRFIEEIDFDYAAADATAALITAVS